jgi:hypothetical protein
MCRVGDTPKLAAVENIAERKDDGDGSVEPLGFVGLEPDAQHDRTLGRFRKGITGKLGSLNGQPVDQDRSHCQLPLCRLRRRLLSSCSPASAAK